MEKNNRIVVLGGGLWGTVLAQHLCRAKARREVRLWEFFPELAGALRMSRRHAHIPGFRLDESVEVTSDLAQAVEAAEVLFFVLPSGALRRTAQAASRCLGKAAPLVVNASKGIERSTLKTMGEVIAAEVPRARGVYTLSGPSFAREVAQGVATRLVLAGPGGAKAERLRGLIDGGPLKVSWSSDRIGVELGGSLKNVLAIGCGILDGLPGPGANTKAALLVQGMSEMGRLIAACGGKAETIYGVAGLGDLILTGTSRESRNRAFGEKLGRGKTVQAALGEIPTVVEGIEATESAYALARRAGVKTPLIDAIWKTVRGGKPPKTVMGALGFN